MPEPGPPPREPCPRDAHVDVVLASCLTMPAPDPDEAPLVAALAAAGVGVKTMAWDDPAADFSAARMVVIRSTWNYWDVPAAFAAWIERTARVADLWNRAATLRWNLHKGYLLDLQRAGVPIVPTLLLPRGQPAALADAARALGSDDLVVKPAISAGSCDTLRVRPADRARGEAHLASLLGKGDTLVQPYLSSIEGYGERSLVCIDGELTHAIRKAPRFQGDPWVFSEAVPIAPDERELARRILAAVPGPLLYARMDLVRGHDGAPCVMEVELTEPSLFLHVFPPAIDRFVDAIRARLPG